MIEAILHIEALGRTRLAVEERLKRTLDGLDESGLKVKYMDVGALIEDEELDPLRFSALVEARVEGELEDIFKAVVDYAPTVVEILGPGRIEIGAPRLSSVMGSVVENVHSVMLKYGFKPVLPELGEVPLPPVGFDEEELWEMVYRGRNLLYEASFSLSGGNEESVGEALLKLLLLEGCGVSSIEVLKLGDDAFSVHTEVVSPFESLLAVVLKYLPREITVVEPEVVDITAAELQNGLSDLGSFVNSILLGEDLQKAYEKDTFSFKLDGEESKSI